MDMRHQMCSKCTRTYAHSVNTKHSGLIVVYLVREIVLKLSDGPKVGLDASCVEPCIEVPSGIGRESEKKMHNDAMHVMEAIAPCISTHGTLGGVGKMHKIVGRFVVVMRMRIELDAAESASTEKEKQKGVEAQNKLWQMALPGSSGCGRWWLLAMFAVLCSSWLIV